MPEFEELIEGVRIARRARDYDKKCLEALQDEFNDRNAARIESLRINKERCEESESLLREKTLDAFALDPTNKKPADGVGIRIVTKISYDLAEAFAWAKAHTVCLKLDDKAFEALAKIAPDTMPVKIENTPQATIAKEL